MLITLGFTLNGCSGLTLTGVAAALKWTSSCLRLLSFLRFFKSSFWFVSLRHKLGLRGRISCVLGRGVSANLFPLKPSNSGNRIFATKKTMVLNNSLSPGNNNLYHPNARIIREKSPDVQKFYRDFPGKMKTTRVWRSAPALGPSNNNKNNIKNNNQ